MKFVYMIGLVAASPFGRMVAHFDPASLKIAKQKQPTYVVGTAKNDKKIVSMKCFMISRSSKMAVLAYERARNPKSWRLKLYLDIIASNTQANNH